MLGRKERRQPELFVAGSLRDLLLEDPVLVGVDRVLDLSRLSEDVAELYDADGGWERPAIRHLDAVRRGYDRIWWMRAGVAYPR